MNDGDRALRLENARLRRDLADSRRQLEEVRGEFDRFAGRLAHDLQAAMQVNEGFATALSRTAAPKLDDRERHYLERMAANSLRGNRLVHEVLAFARIGVHPIERRLVALSDVLARARHSLQDQLEGRQVDWVVGELPTVTGDASLLQQVLVDLLANALHSSRERPRAVIRIEGIATDAGWEIGVTDNGADFDPEAADRLLHSFGRQPGTGGDTTGLALARRIVERHGGSLRAQAAAGGAVFAFTLPATDGLELPAAGSPDAAQQPADPPRPAALRVLLVDDDPMVLLSLTNMVQLDGHHVDSAAGGQAGVEAFRRALAQGQGYDAVITDLGMPHMDGREVARLVKQADPATRVILLTGWGSGAGDGDEHVDGILTKPPRLAQLRQALAPGRPA